MTPERKQQLEAMLQSMTVASGLFYLRAISTECHPFVEFTGLMNEYIKLCQDALARGIDFTESSTHTGAALPIANFRAAYLGEKFDCIFGPSFRADDEARRTFEAKWRPHD